MRKPDLIIGSRDNPQTLRWHIVCWRGWQLALHKWCRSDEDRALHDHSGNNVSLILSPQGYNEIVRERAHDEDYPCEPVGWIHAGDGEFYRDVTVRRRAWIPYFRRAEAPHRIALRDARPVWSLWLRWPPHREWGFWCPRGWRHWKDFLGQRDYNADGISEVGRGCD